MEVDKDKYPDVMVDVESTGTDYEKNAIIQISAVRFNLRERTVSPDFFDRCLMIPPNRYWDEGARAFWMKRKEIFADISARMEPAQRVLQDFADWVGFGDKVMWAKPTHFDHSFLANYFREYEVRQPFFYRIATDMNSFIRGLYFPETPPDWERMLPFEGPLHNALFDTLHQVRVLMKASEDAMSRREQLITNVTTTPETKNANTTAQDVPSAD